MASNDAKVVPFVRQPTPQVMDDRRGILVPWLLEQAGLGQAAVERRVRQCRLPS